MKSDPDAYLRSWNLELTARADRVRQLIGEAHWVTDGSHKESILREFIARLISQRFTVGSGFVTSLRETAKCSTEVDILISDFSNHPPFFNEGGVQIIPPDSLVAHIESKSTFSKPPLIKALRGIARIQDVLPRGHDEVWRGICFASVPNSRDFQSFRNTVVESIRELIANDGKIESTDPHLVINIDRLPQCIATYSPFVSFITKAADKKITVNTFEYQDLGVSILINDLFEHLRGCCGHKHEGHFSNLIEEITKKNYAKDELELK